jgi:hypothetical protein
VATNSEKVDSSNIYFVAFRTYLINSDLVGDLFLEENDLTTSSIPSQLEGINVQVLNANQIKKKSKKDPLTLYRIIPLRFEEGIFFVNIIPFKVRYKRKNFEMVNQGGISVKFKFNCEEATLTVLD